jgi:polysaccharide pyruvyl transferase WcaK-like protein
MEMSFNHSRVQKVIRDQDLLIIGGGNLLMDLFANGVDLIENITNAAQVATTPYSFLGVGAGPIKKASSAPRLAACLAPAQHVMVRDLQSRALCIDLLRRADAICTPDLAFALPPHGGKIRREGLAVNVAAVGAQTWPVRDAEGYELYLEGMTRLVLDAATQIQPMYIEIVTTNPAVDSVAAQDLAARLKRKTGLPVRLPVLRDVTDVLDAFGCAKVAIITRLHAGITAALAGAPVLPVAYQPKVASVLSEAGIAPNSIALEALKTRDFDTGPALAQVFRHTAGPRPEIRTQALDAIRDLLLVPNKYGG